MAKVKKSITVNAPIEKVFEYISETTNLLEIWPSLINVKDMHWTVNGRWFRWAYKMAGLFFEGTAKDIEYKINDRIVTETEEGLRSTIMWGFEPENGKTKVTFIVEYQIPVPLLGRLADIIIKRINDHEGDLVMANLKVRMEG
ncbi:SRPBCC family protein [Chloroflexota bacterium]